MHRFQDRVGHAWLLLTLVRKRVAVAAVFAFAVLGGLQIVRDELADESQKWLFVRSWIPDWPLSWWIIAALCVLLVLLVEGSFRAAHPPDAGVGIPYDPSAPKRFTTLTILELFQTQHEMDTRAKALFAPHVGLWAHAEGALTNVAEDGPYTVAVLNYSDGILGRVPPPPQGVLLYFQGDDAQVIRSLNEGDFIRADGRIVSIDLFNGLVLAPSLLSDYRRSRPTGAG